MDHRRPDLPRVPTMAYFMTDEGQVQEGIKETSALYLSWKVDIIKNLFIFSSICMIYRPVGVLRFELDRGVPLEPQNPYPSLRVILAKKGTHF